MSLIEQKANIYTAYHLSAALSCIYTTVKLQVISQQLGTATAEEQTLLQIHESNSWIREVYLLGNDAPVVHARVVAPYKTYLQYKNALDNLGNNFLGKTLLYKLPHTRSVFIFKEHNYNMQRQSTINIDDLQFLLTETFLIDT